MPRVSLPTFRLPVLPRTVLVAALVLAALLVVPVVYVLSASGHATAAKQTTANHLPTTNAGAPKAGSAEGVAISAVQSKTGLKYSTSCKGACLSLTGQNLGQGAAAFIFATAKTGGRECVSYVVQTNGKWQPLGSVLCALPNQVSPVVGRDATVHVPGNCANVHAAPSLQGGVVTCLYDGTAVHVDGGPTAADGLVWWHTSKGWIAHDFLVGP